VWLFHNNPRGQFFSRNRTPTFISNRDFPLVNLIRASTAAPTYFEPEYIEIAPGIAGAFVDGGVSPHNNPALLLLMLATLKGYGFRWPLGADNLMMVSIGTGATVSGSLASSMHHKPAAMLAVSALESLMTDCTWLISDADAMDEFLADLVADRLRDR
jgi:hypothetical protein